VFVDAVAPYLVMDSCEFSASFLSSVIAS